MSLRVIIVEDNIEFITQLKREITRLFLDEFEIVGTANSIQSAYDLITSTGCDLVLFDIELPDGNGLQLAEKLVKERKYLFQFLFISSFDIKENLLKSIRLRSIDFVTKPLQNNELQEALLKVLDNKNKNELIEFIHQAFLDVDQAGSTISIETGKKRFRLIPIDQIMLAETNVLGRTKFYLQNGEQLIGIQRLSYFKTLWDGEFQFLKVNRSQYVNIHYLNNIDTDRKQILLKNGQVIQLSRRPTSDILGKTRFFSLTKKELYVRIQAYLNKLTIR